MEKNLTIIDKDYLQWVKDLALRYRQSQIKAAVKVNQEALMFYLLYSGLLITPQLGEQIGAREISPQLGDKIPFNIFSIPWGHHKLLIDKYKKQPEKTLFYVHKTIENGWSRAQLGNQWLPNYKSVKMK